MAVRRTHGAIATVLMLALAGCAQQPVDSADDPSNKPGTSQTRPAEPNMPALPGGWRWESFGGVQVGVPGEWGWGVGGQRLSQWCVGDERAPIVGRPGPVTLVGCGLDADQDRGTLLENTGPVVSLEPAALWDADEVPPDGRSEEGDRLTVIRDGVSIAIQTEPRLRERIAETVHSVHVDAYGCPAQHPVHEHPATRPDQPVAVDTITDITAVSVCRFALQQDGQYPVGADPLLSSLRLEGQEAADAVARITDAPVGGGPDRPSQCLDSVSYGDELIVLRIDTAQGPSEVYFRYSGCDHNGFDDGFVVRTLTHEAVRPLVVGPNQITSASGPPEKFRMLRPDLR